MGMNDKCLQSICENKSGMFVKQRMEIQNNDILERLLFAYTISPIEFYEKIKSMLNGELPFDKERVFNIENIMQVKAVVSYDPNAEYDYYTMYSSLNDGTAIFEYETIGKCLLKPFNLETYYIPKKDLVMKNSIIKYTIGDLVVFTAESKLEDKPKDKPWLDLELQCCLPIKFEVFNETNRKEEQS